MLKSGASMRGERTWQRRSPRGGWLAHRPRVQEITRRAVASLTRWEKIRRQGEIAEGISVTLQQQVARQLSLRYRVLQDLADAASH